VPVPLVEVPTEAPAAPPALDVFAPVVLAGVPVLAVVVVLDVAPDPLPPDSSTPAQPRTQRSVMQSGRRRSVTVRPLYHLNACVSVPVLSP
jgi:hypothetical protein